MFTATPVKLFEAANRASLDAIAWARQPNGEALASIRRRDARALRALARDILRASAG